MLLLCVGFLPEGELIHSSRGYLLTNDVHRQSIPSFTYSTLQRPIPESEILTTVPKDSSVSIIDFITVP